MPCGARRSACGNHRTTGRRKVKGKNKDVHRHMFNFVVDSVSQSYEELKARGVKFLSKPFKAPTFDKYFATFYDLDNNLIQIIGDK